MRSDRSRSPEESPVRVRAATQGDQDELRALVRSERLNPTDLDWRRFLVAVEGTQIVGAVQLRRHADGSRELGSLVVRRQARGRGVAAALIDTLLSAERGRVLMITNGRFAAHYARWQFRRIASRAAPGGVRRNYRIGQAIAVFRSLLRGRWPVRLAILERASARPGPEPTRDAADKAAELFAARNADAGTTPMPALLSRVENARRRVGARRHRQSAGEVR